MIRGTALVGVLATLLFAPPTWCQTRFDITSIRPNPTHSDPTPENLVINPGGIMYSGVTLQDCIVATYGVKWYQVSGGPEWIGGEHFDVIGKAEGDHSKQELMQMLQALLADRFQMTMHREEREMPVFALTVIKNGAKLKESDGQEGASIGQVAGGIGLHNMSMPDFTGLFLSRFPMIGRPVLDKTGLQGRYDFTLQLTPNGKADVRETKRALHEEGFSIVTYALDQLGLKLESEKAMIEMIVIDRAEKPDTN